MLFFDVKNNIIKDEEEFKKEQSRNLKAQISLVSLEDQSFQILLTFGDNQEFWRNKLVFVNYDYILCTLYYVNLITGSMINGSKILTKSINNVNIL